MKLRCTGGATICRSGRLPVVGGVAGVTAARPARSGTELAASGLRTAPDELVGLPSALPPLTMILAAVSRPVELDDLGARKREVRRPATASKVRSRTPLGSCRIEAGGATVTTLIVSCSARADEALRRRSGAEGVGVRPCGIDDRGTSSRDATRAPRSCRARWRGTAGGCSSGNGSTCGRRSQAMLFGWTPSECSTLANPGSSIGLRRSLRDPGRRSAVTSPRIERGGPVVRGRLEVPWSCSALQEWIRSPWLRS